MTTTNAHAQLRKRTVCVRVRRTLTSSHPSTVSSHVQFRGGCLQDSRLIGSAPGELRLGANFSVLATSQPNYPLPGLNAGGSLRFGPLTRGHRCEPSGSAPVCER